MNSLEQAAAQGAMVALHLERHKNRTIELLEKFPSIITQPRTYMGSFCWTSTNKRLISSRHAVDVLGVKMTPADIAREYLYFRYGNQRRRMHTDAYCKCFKPHHKSPPLYAVPTVGELVYLDIKSAYWSILSTVGWDVDYHPDEFIGVRSSNDDFPFREHKLARNILVSTGLPSRVQVWTGKRIISINGRNKLYNGVLWCFVQDVLNGIAHDMVSIGAVYVHTDGFIFRQSDEQYAREIAAAWGLPLGVKYRGEGEVFGVSNYWIKGKKQRNPRSAHRTGFSKIQTCEKPDWLRQRFREWREFQKLPLT